LLWAELASLPASGGRTQVLASPPFLFRLRQLGEEVKNHKFDGANAVLPVRFTTASGHGIGKNVLVAFPDERS